MDSISPLTGQTNATPSLPAQAQEPHPDDEGVDNGTPRVPLRGGLDWAPKILGDTNAVPATPQPSRIAVMLGPSPTLIQPKSVTDMRGIGANQVPKGVKKSLGIIRPHSSDPPRSITAAARPRGRPKGRKNNTTQANLRPDLQLEWAVTGRKPRLKAPQAGFARRKPGGPGRPPRQPSPSPVGTYQRLQAHFVAFLCEWSDCRAELHNLDTLRKHLHQVHIRDRSHSCQWGICSKQLDTNQTADAPVLRRHIEEVHLAPFSWHVGDGPQNTIDALAGDKGPSHNLLPNFLFAKDGTQVTPSVQDQQFEDFATWRDNQRKLKELLVRRDNNLPSESETSDSGD